MGIFGINPGMMTTDFLTDLQVVSGYEKRLQVMPTIMRMWAKPPEVPAEKVVWLASAATDGKTGRVRLADGARRRWPAARCARACAVFFAGPRRGMPMTVQTLPATLPLPNRAGRASGPLAPGERRMSSDMTYFGFLIRFIGVPLLIMARADAVGRAPGPASARVAPGHARLVRHPRARHRRGRVDHALGQLPGRDRRLVLQP